jgi:hypothetical protein
MHEQNKTKISTFNNVYRFADVEGEIYLGLFQLFLFGLISSRPCAHPACKIRDRKEERGKRVCVCARERERDCRHPCIASPVKNGVRPFLSSALIQKSSTTFKDQ